MKRKYKSIARILKGLKLILAIARIVNTVDLAVKSYHDYRHLIEIEHPSTKVPPHLLTPSQSDREDNDCGKIEVNAQCE